MEVEETGIGRVRCARAFNNRLERGRPIRGGEGEGTVEGDGLAGARRQQRDHVAMERAVTEKGDLNDAIHRVREHIWIDCGTEGPSRSCIDADVRRVNGVAEQGRAAE